MKLSNDVEKYEIEVTKMDQNYSFFLTVYYGLPSDCQSPCPRVPIVSALQLLLAFPSMDFIVL